MGVYGRPPGIPVDRDDFAREVADEVERAFQDKCFDQRPPAGVVARNMSAIVILDNFLDKFGKDCKNDIDKAFRAYKKRINEI